MIIAIDVGKGTEDVLVIDETRGPSENSIQTILPSRAQLLYSNLIDSKKYSDWFFYGEIMAGEPWHQLVYQHAQNPINNVIMTPKAAMSLRYHPQEVKEKGIRIENIRSPDNYKSFFTSDIDWFRIDAVLSGSGIRPHEINKVLLACQDHGFPPSSDQSSRDFRMKTIYAKLKINGNLSDLLYSKTQIPGFLPRHKSISESALHHYQHLENDDIFVMDSSPAVANSMMPLSGKNIIINIGNGHTLAVIIDEDEVQAVYETHTSGVKPSVFIETIGDIIKNKVTHEYILNTGGHGLYQREGFHLKDDITNYRIYLIGPNRKLLSEIPDVTLGFPLSSMMMAGPLGLYKAFRDRG